MDDAMIDSSLRTVEWKDNKVIMIDQTKLPNQLVFVKYDDYNQVADAIRNLVVRGAPAPDTPIAGAPLTTRFRIASATWL